jgi:heptosyltransferase I
MRLFEHPPRSVCILRLSALGDVTHVVPVIRALQQHWPATHICWIIGVAEHRLLQRLPGVEFLVFDKRGGWPAIRDLRKRLAGRRFDVLLHMQVAARANLLSRLVRASLRLGWNRARSRDLHHCFIDRAVADVPMQHQVQGFLEFPRAMGLQVDQPCWDLPVSAEAMDWARARLEPGRRTLVVSPCSSHELRNWPARHFAAVADFAAAELGMQVVLSGGPGDRERQTAAAIGRMMRQPCLDLVGQDTLEQSMALLSLADLLISPDSGPAHIASALGTPVLGLYAPTWSRRSGPYRSLDLCVDHYAEAARRFRRCEPESLRWGTRIEVPGVMDLIHPAEVIGKLRQWWESGGTASRR